MRWALSVVLAGVSVLWLAGAVKAQEASPLSAPDRSSPKDWMTPFLAEADAFENAYTACREDHSYDNVRDLYHQMMCCAVSLT